MRVLVAGCGYVGGALAGLLAEAGHEVFGLRRNASAVPEGVTGVAADLSVSAALREALSPVFAGGLDAIAYTAAADGRDEPAYRRAYVTGLANVIDAAAAAGMAPRLLFTSSTSVHGQDSGEWVEETSPAEPASFRGAIMLEAEALVASHGGAGSALRLGGIYGPGRTRLLESVRRGEAERPAAPHYTNRIHRDDAARALAHLLVLDALEGLYLGVDDEPAERGEVLTWLASRLGAPSPPTATSEAPRTSGKRCRNARLRATGFAFSYPTFREGYEAMIAEMERAAAGA